MLEATSHVLPQTPCVRLPCQAPKNHGEPADLEAVEKAFRHLYRNSYEMKTGKMSAQDNAEIFVKGIEDAIGVDNIGTLKRIKKELSLLELLIFIQPTKILLLLLLIYKEMYLLDHLQVLLDIKGLRKKLLMQQV